MWEPALAHLIAENAQSANPVNIAEVWLWESINHGDSALVNDYNSMGGLCERITPFHCTRYSLIWIKTTGQTTPGTC